MDDARIHNIGEQAANLAQLVIAKLKFLPTQVFEDSPQFVGFLTQEDGGGPGYEISDDVRIPAQIA
jgi:hypothetical protein